MYAAQQRLSQIFAAFETSWALMSKCILLFLKIQIQNLIHRKWNVIFWQWCWWYWFRSLPAPSFRLLLRPIFPLKSIETKWSSASLSRRQGISNTWSRMHICVCMCVCVYIYTSLVVSWWKRPFSSPHHATCPISVQHNCTWITWLYACPRVWY